MKQKQNFVRKNEQIRYNQVLLVKDGVKLGFFSSRDALYQARQAGLDLVEVAPNAKPPVCAIIDYGKYLYEQSKAKKNKSHSIKEKEIVFRYVIDKNDLNTKINQAKKFLEKGDRVKLVVKFKSREHAHKDQGWNVIKEAIEMLKEYGNVEKPPAMEGNTIAVRIIKNK